MTLVVPTLIRAPGTLLVLALVAVSFVAGASAQAQDRTQLDLGWERDVNRFRWTADLASQVRQGTWDIALRNAFRSDAFILFDDRLSFRDENRFAIDAVQNRPGPYNLTVRTRSNWFSLSRVFHQDAWLGVRKEFDAGWWVEPSAGLAIDARPGFRSGTTSAPVRTDAGPAVGVLAGMGERNLDGYLTEVGVRTELQRFSPRTGRLLRARARSSRDFERTSLRAEVEASSVRRDAYQAASFLNREEGAARQEETVESTRSDTVFVRFGVESRLSRSSRLELNLDVGTNARRVRTLRAPDDALFFDSDFRRQTVELTLAGVRDVGTGFLRLSSRVGAEIERRTLANAAELPPAQVSQKLNLLRQADNDRGFAGLSASGLVPFRRRLSMQFDASANILQHDTPDVNPDDRDELLLAGSVGVAWRVHRGLTVSSRAFGSFFHTVYLKNERSADNNEQTSIRLQPLVDFQPTPKTRIRLASEVRATFTVDDFLLPGRRPTDQSARELSYDLDASHDVGDDVRVMLTANWSDLQLGRFLDDVFAEIPFDTLRTFSGWLRLETGRNVRAEIGVRWFVRSDFERATTIRFTSVLSGEEDTVSRSGRTRIDQVGPTMAITWPMRQGSFLRLDGWATVQRVSTRLYGELPDTDAKTIRRAARRGQSTLIPNLSVSMVVLL